MGSSSESLSGSPSDRAARTRSSAAEHRRSTDFDDWTSHADYDEGSRTWGNHYAAGAGLKPTVDSDKSESFASKRTAEWHAYYFRIDVHTRVWNDRAAKWDGSEFGVGKHELE